MTIFIVTTNIWGRVCMSFVWCSSQTRTQHCKAENTFLGFHLWFFCGLFLTQILCPWIAAVRASQLAERSKCIWIHLLLASGSCLSGEASSGLLFPAPASFQCLLCCSGCFPDLCWNKGWELCELCGYPWVCGQQHKRMQTLPPQLLRAFCVSAALEAAQPSSLMNTAARHELVHRDFVKGNQVSLLMALEYLSAYGFWQHYHFRLWKWCNYFTIIK